MNSRALCCGVTVVCCVGWFLSCFPQKSGLGVELGPGKLIEGPRQELTLAFDRPMVPGEAVGRRVAPVPFSVDPPLTGRAQWKSDRELTLRPDRPLPPSTRFTVTLSGELRSLDGHHLAGAARRLVFETPRIQAEVKLVDGGKRPLGLCGPEQHVNVSFSQPVRGAEVLRRCSYRTLDDKRTAAALVRADGNVVAAAFEVKPARALALGETYRLECDRGLRGAWGQLGLAQPALVPFKTYGRFTLEGLDARSDGSMDPDYQTSFQIVFSNRVVARSVRVRLEPAQQGGGPPSCYPYGWGERIRCHARLAANTTYQVTVNPSVVDQHGQRLGEAKPLSFKTGAATPRLFVETGQWVVEKARPTYVAWARNIDRVKVTAARVPAARLPGLLPLLRWWDAAAVDLSKAKLSSTITSVKAKVRSDRWDQLRLRPHELVGGEVSGFYYLALDAPEDDSHRARELLLNVTDLSLVSKLAGASGLVWVMSSSTGKPVAGASVVIRDQDGRRLWRGRTDGQGLASTPGRAWLMARARRLARGSRGKRGADAAEERAGGSPWVRLLVFARKGSDQTFVDPQRPGGLAAYNFNLSPDESDRDERLRGFMHTDRGIYRPGDTVHVKGLARTLRLGAGLRVPRQRGLVVRVNGPRGDTVLEKKARLSPFGGFSFDVSLRGDARLGDYRIVAEHPVGSFRQSFTVEEYRPANFEVKTRPEEPWIVAGIEAAIRTEARYFYGAPVRGGKVKWTVNRRRRAARFTRHRGYVFGKEQPRWERWSSSSGHEYVTEQQGKLDGAGRATLKLQVGPDELSEDYDYLIRADVADESNQTIASRLVLPVSHRDRYLGIKTAAYFTAVRKPVALSLLAVDPSGSPVASAARLRVERVDWRCAYEEGGYSGAYRCQDQREVVLRRRLALTPAAHTVSFTPRTSGRYEVVLEGKDGRGRPLHAARTLYAWGGGAAAWEVRDSIRFDAIPDKPRYRPGDTARLLLKTPLTGAEGLLTVERDGVLERRRFRLRPGQQSLTLPIKGSYAPNVYATVSLFRGRSGSGRRGKPLVRVAMVNLPVDTGAKRLTVEVRTGRREYRPGAPVQARIRVTDAAGRPVRGEVSLAAADEGVLSLIGFKTPDPLPIFYAPWGLGVTSATQLERLSHAPDPGEERNTTGGDRGPGSVRSRFLATAFWKGSIVTDAGGRAAVTFAAPDNLTAFRLMAVAADAKDRFGSGDRRFTVSKPLQLHQALPRFLTVGDEARAGVVVHNETGRGGQAVVRARIEGLELRSAPTQTVHVPAGGRVPVRFLLGAVAPGRARLRFSVRLGRERDAVEHRLEVSHPGVVETALLQRGSARGEASIPVKPPPGVLSETAMVTVSLDRDGLAGVERGLEDLVGYPYGCLEQTTSKVIPMVMVKELARQVKIARLDRQALQRYLRAGVAKIGRHQTASGGFSLWPHSEPGVYYTAYALWGLHLARKAGMDVDPRRISDGVRYLKRALSQPVKNSPVHNELGDLGSKAFALYVLSLLGHADGQAATRFASSDGSNLPLFGKAFLVRALAASTSVKQPAVRSLLEELERAAAVKDGRALVKEPGGDKLAWYMSSDTRSSAIILDALVALRPQSKKVHPLVKGLMRAGQHYGRWSTTQETLYSLLALTRYAQGRAAHPASAELIIGRRAVARARLGRGQRVARLQVPLARVEGQALRLRVSGAQLHYAAHLSFRRGREHQKAHDGGIGLRYEYLHPETGEPLKAIRAGDVVRVRVRMRTKQQLNHVMLSHRLPAAFEPINVRLKTSGRQGAQDVDSHRWAWRGYRHLELRDERIDYAVEWLQPGEEVREFLVRATTPGLFVVPASRAEEMYEPETHGQTAVGTVKVLPR